MAVLGKPKDFCCIAVDLPCETRVAPTRTLYSSVDLLWLFAPPFKSDTAHVPSSLSATLGFSPMHIGLEFR